MLAEGRRGEERAERMCSVEEELVLPLTLRCLFVCGSSHSKTKAADWDPSCLSSHRIVHSPLCALGAVSSQGRQGSWQQI